MGIIYLFGRSHLWVYLAFVKNHHCHHGSLPLLLSYKFLLTSHSSEYPKDIPVILFATVDSSEGRETTLLLRSDPLHSNDSASLHLYGISEKLHKLSEPSLTICKIGKLDSQISTALHNFISPSKVKARSGTVGIDFCEMGDSGGFHFSPVLSAFSLTLKVTSQIFLK